MFRCKTFLSIFVGLAMLGGVAAAAQVRITEVIDDLDEPWAIAFLPDGGYLVTERDGALLHIKDDKRREVGGLPRVAAEGQGGLLDVMLPRDFASSREVFLTYSARTGQGLRTMLGSGRLATDGRRLEGFRALFEQVGPGGSGRHFGSRVVEATDGTLLLTIGDRGDRPSAQDLSVHSGKIIRINRDGSVPSDNPDFGRDARPEIFSYGHRNPQGAGLDARGRLWTAEHGARGGDEVNQPQAGRNYGWPVISYGVHYSGEAIGEGSSKAGMEQPAHYWDPSIAPSGLMVYSGDMFPDWKGDIFVGSLKFDYISRLEVSGGQASEVEELFRGEYGRIRDVREAPDGAIWFLSVGEGAAYRVTPE